MKKRIVQRRALASVALALAVALGAAACQQDPSDHPQMFCPDGQHLVHTVTGAPSRQLVCVR